MISEKDIIICGHGSGNPSLKNMYTYLFSRYAMTASNGKHKGIIAVMRLKALTDAKRVEFKNTYQTIIGRNIYNQNLRDYVYIPYNGKYYSDCSSSGMATFRKIGYNVSLLNTAGIYQSNLFEEVPVIISEGHIQNPEILKVGDALLFVGNDPSRPRQIGHVEYVYSMPTVPSNKSGWVKEDGGWRYYHGDSEEYVRHDWVKWTDSSGHEKWSWFLDNGLAVHDDWVEYAGNWYYFNSDCFMAVSSWILWKDVYYYVNSDGMMVKGKFVKSIDKEYWYYLNENGEWDKTNNTHIKPLDKYIAQ